MAGAGLLAFFICLAAIALQANGGHGVEPVDPAIGLIGLIVLGGCIATLGASGSSDGKRKEG